jgi:FixJ family two-component response regulator
MSTTDQTVFIVDDDEGSRDSVRAMISTMSLPSQVFDSAEHFLESYVGEPGCLISDLRLPGLHVVELLDRLNTQGVDAGQKT